MTDLILIAHNLRSAHNVGSLLRTAEGLNVTKVFLTGYTPYPLLPKDVRLPHEARKTDSQIVKTALGAEKLVDWAHADEIKQVVATIKKSGYEIAALEQASGSIKLQDFSPPPKLAIIVGREVEGLEKDILKTCDYILEIPMLGRKESFNVVQAAAMALYQMRFKT